MTHYYSIEMVAPEWTVADREQGTTTQERLEEALEEVKRLRATLRAEQIAMEPEVGSVITFSRGRYEYAAVHAGNGRWYTTGISCPRNGYLWLDLWAFIHADGNRAPVRVGTNWKGIN